MTLSLVVIINVVVIVIFNMTNMTKGVNEIFFAIIFKRISLSIVLISLGKLFHKVGPVTCKV